MLGAGHERNVQREQHWAFDIEQILVAQIENMLLQISALEHMELGDLLHRRAGRVIAHEFCREHNDRAFDFGDGDVFSNSRCSRFALFAECRTDAGFGGGAAHRSRTHQFEQISFFQVVGVIELQRAGAGARKRNERVGHRAGIRHFPLEEAERRLVNGVFLRINTDHTRQRAGRGEQIFLSFERQFGARIGRRRGGLRALRNENFIAGAGHEFEAHRHTAGFRGQQLDAQHAEKGDEILVRRLVEAFDHALGQMREELEQGHATILIVRPRPFRRVVRQPLLEQRQQVAEFSLINFGLFAGHGLKFLRTSRRDKPD
ncbi:hypothetical protein L6R21_20995 [bacterium]|nr:hypothetical protein [bacterium]